MKVVLDASVAISFIIIDEFSHQANKALERVAEQGALVPALWDFELANALRSAERRGRISQAGTAQGIAGIKGLDIERVGPPTNLTRLIDVARERDISVYDSSYLALALDRGLPLLTFDTRLGQAAAAAGVHLIQ